MLRVVWILALGSLSLPRTAFAQSPLLAPAAHGERVLRGFFLPPTDGPVVGYTAGHALLLRDPGGLVADLSRLCESFPLSPDEARAAIRRRLSGLAVRRTESVWRRFEFGTVPPGAYIAVAWIELRLAPLDGKGPERVRAHFGADRAVIDVRTDTAHVMFNTGRPRFRPLAELSEALSCLEFRVVPSPAERVMVRP